MKSLADLLPPEIAQQIHPDYRRNEAEYWSMRDGLLAEYLGKWVAFADGQIIAFAATSLDLFLSIRQSERHPFVIRVGHEQEPWARSRVVDERRGLSPLSSRNAKTAGINPAARLRLA